jgi:hypothetical protein
VRHAIDGKLTLDLERTRLNDISQTWEHLKAAPPQARGHTLTSPALQFPTVLAQASD